MTEHDAPAATAQSPEPDRHGLWRALSLLAVLIAVIVATVAVLQARTAGNVKASEVPEIELEETQVRVSGLALPTDPEIGVLGISSTSDRQPFDINGTNIDIPVAMPSLIALYDASGAIIGLATVPAVGDRDLVQISPASTARSLLVISPALLRADIAATLADVTEIEKDAVFTTLVDAIASDSNISRSNEAVERALAQILDRVPMRIPPADQGCDSVLDVRAFAATGACVQPQGDAMLVTNEQDRWALLYSGPSPWSTVCGTLAPVRMDGSEAVIDGDSCSSDVLLVAPGSLRNQGDDQALIESRVRTASALNILTSYVGPFADLAADGSGYSRDASRLIQSDTASIVGALDQLNTDESFAAASGLSLSSSTPVQRHRAALATARQIIDADDGALIPQRRMGNSQHVPILDFLDRTGDQMAASRTDWRWEADAAGTFAIGSDS